MRLIDADALIPLIRMGECNMYDEYCQGRNGGIEFAVNQVNDMPSVSIEQIRWERDMAISQLRELGYSLGEKMRTDGDIISRQAAIDEIKAVYEWHDVPTEERMIQHFKALPTAQPKKGKWEEIKVFPASEIELQSARCSACKRYHTTPYLYNYTHYNFCPHCGARMVNEDE